MQSFSEQNSTVHNDHLPLKSLFKHLLSTAPPRTQRFILRLPKYCFEMHYIQDKRLTEAGITIEALILAGNIQNL